jgi:SPP1 family predicted phage head-tail adaptor
MINSGSLFGNIQFFVGTPFTDNSGQTIITYKLIANTRANVNSTNGKFYLQNGQREGIDPINFTIRYRTDFPINTSLILVYQGYPYQIYSITDVQNKRKEFQILARTWENLKNITLTNGTVMEFGPQFSKNFE